MKFVIRSIDVSTPITFTNYKGPHALG